MGHLQYILGLGQLRHDRGAGQPVPNIIKDRPRMASMDMVSSTSRSRFNRQLHHHLWLIYGLFLPPRLMPSPGVPAPSLLVGGAIGSSGTSGAPSEGHHRERTVGHNDHVVGMTTSLRPLGARIPRRLGIPMKPPPRAFLSKRGRPRLPVAFKSFGLVGFVALVFLKTTSPLAAPPSRTAPPRFICLAANLCPEFRALANG